jgi:23S rRNA (cytosine1962-C5)-methyltransferase
MASPPIVRLRPKAGARARAGAPWIYSNEIDMTRETKALEPGALVQAIGDDGAVFGVGAFNPHSLIAIRLLHWRETGAVDTEFFAARIEAALALRERLFDAPYYRLVHAEGDRLPGLIVDRFDGVLSVQVNTAGMERLQPLWLEALRRALNPRAIVLRNDAPSRALEGLQEHVSVLEGDVPAPMPLRENGAVFQIDPQGGQKTGWYFDQREWRQKMAQLAKGGRVLDAFCYTGGFGVQALLAGAGHAVFLDASEPALSLARTNAGLNGVQPKAEFRKADVFEALEAMQTAERFDTVIADPPPFVRARKDLEAGAKAYRKLARLTAQAAMPGGFLFLASCSHAIEPERFLVECVAGIAKAGRTGRILHQGGAGPDHPVHPHLPETAYLKALVFQLD